MTDPDIIDAMIQRVRDQCPGLATVDEAWFAEPIDNFDAQTPAAAIFLAEDGSASDMETIRPTQRITLSYGIWLVCKRADFRPQRHAIRQALFGHVFTERHDATAYRGGQTTDIHGELIWWREFWNVDTWLRGTQ